MKIRSARAEDVRAMSELNAAAFAGTLGASLGPRYEEAFLRFFLQEPAGLVLVAECDGRVAGLVYGAPDGYELTLRRRLLSATAWGFLKRPRLVLHPNFLPHLIRRVRSFVGFPEMATDLPAAEPPVFSLVGIGTHPAFRGRGIAGRLVEAFASETADGGYTSVILDVYRENDVARRLYEARGFRVLWERNRVCRYWLNHAWACERDTAQPEGI